MNKKFLLGLLLFLIFPRVSRPNNHLEQYLAEGQTYDRKGDFSKAVASYRKVISCQDQTFETFLQRGKAFYFLDNHAASQEEYEKALALDPQSIDAQYSLAESLFLQDDFFHSQEILKYILHQHPTHLHVWSFLGRLYLANHQPDKAVICFQAFNSMVPDSPIMHYHLGTAYLYLGRFAEGFEKFEQRKKVELLDLDNLDVPNWQGESLEGKKLLIYSERGYGDILQFIRYARKAKELGATVYLYLHLANLVPLLFACSYIDKIIPVDCPVPDCDYKIRLMSFPYVCKTTLESIPEQVPYLFVDEVLVQEWHEKLSCDNNFKIGLCWEGAAWNPNPSLRHSARKRTIDLKSLAPLAKIPGVSFYSLQKMLFHQDVKTGSSQFIVHDFGPDFDEKHGRFIDTAAVMKNLDLIITIDTSVAHLAGGLGVSVWTLLPYESEWRWLLNRSDSPWYPNMRLFRQRKPNDWDSVVEEVCQALIEVLGKKNEA